MTYEKVLYSLADGVARISMNDPATRNAGSAQMGEELVDAFKRAACEARAVMLTGEGKGFNSGANLADAEAILDDPMRDVGALLDRYFNPVITAHEGDGAAGGHCGARRGGGRRRGARHGGRHHRLRRGRVFPPGLLPCRAGARRRLVLAARPRGRAGCGRWS